MLLIEDTTKRVKVMEALSGHDIKVYAGQESLSQVVQMESIDLVLTALVGYAGLQPTLSAINAGKQLALANKETLVVAGELVTKLAKEKGVNIYPVDSEHSAIFQCLVGEFHNLIEKIYLTASGGPIRGRNKEFLRQIGGIGLFAIDPAAKLSRFENSGVVPDRPAAAIRDYTRNGLVQGFSEGSNVSGVAEMSRLIQIERAFEGVVNGMATSEQNFTEAIRTLGGAL